MNALQRVATIIGYEWRRALAKKKILALIILAIAIQTLLFVAFTQLPPITEDTKATMWIVGALGGQSLFVQLVAVIIAGGSMSEEYERGTADILLSKPIKKLEYLSGKFVGGFSLLVFVEALMVAIGVILGFAFFGSQEHLQFAPLILGAIAYSSLLFFSLTFMFSEVIRKSTLAMLSTIGVFVASTILYTVLLVLYEISVMANDPNEFYLSLSKSLPTWSATNLPTFIAARLMPMLNNPMVALVTGEIELSALIIAAYAIASVLIASIRLVRSDVTKRAD